MKDNLIGTTNETSLLNINNKKQQNLIVESRDDQKLKAIKLMNKELKLGDKWYLINSDWFTRWANFVGYQINNDNDTVMTNQSNKTSISSLSNFLSPDKINNKTLLTNSTDNTNQHQLHLKQQLTEEVDYYTVCEELWNYLVQIYSINSPEDIIERYVIDDGVDGDTSLKIELHKIKVSYALSIVNNNSHVMVEELSRQTSTDALVSHFKSVFKIPDSKQCRLYFKSKDSNVKLHSVEISKTATLNTTGYSQSEIICLDVQDENGDWSITDQTIKSTFLKSDPNTDTLPAATAATSTTSTISSTSTTNNNIPVPPPLIIAPSPISTQQSASLAAAHSHHHPNTRQSSFSNRQSHNEHRPGLCGLSNLGNTCFMNSSIQCMSNVPPLTDYFRTGDYKKEINLVNPLGRKGEIAEAYADLVNEMWSGSNNFTMPRNFKLHLSRFAPQFTGFQQQDSHELLAFLLDGLHEDLNRILKKPYVELGSHVGKTDEVFAEESWQDHKKRNDSIIVDIFHGLLKSTLNCLTCKEISIKFDPYCYLSLPLPSKKERLIEVYFVPLDMQQPITKYKLSVVKNGTIMDLCSALEQHTQVSKHRMTVCDVYTCKFFKVYDHNEAVTNIRERDDIYIYELAANYSNTSEYLKVKVHLKEKNTYQYNSSYFGLPLFLNVPRAQLKYGMLYEYIAKALKRFLKDPSDEINSKLNDSLNVKDEEWDNDENKKVDSRQNGSSSNSINNINDNDSNNEKDESNNSNKLFNLIICKNDNIDYESNSNQSASSYNDDTLIADNMQSTNNNNKDNNSLPITISIIADFGQNIVKRYYNKKAVEDVKEHSSCNAQLVKKKDVISLMDCFNFYTKTEELSEQDYWYCSKCKTHQPSTKKFDLWSLPPVLVIHLKRFSYSRLYRDKIDTQVEFPLTDLDLSSYLINKNVNKTTKYNLIAVSNHYGSLGGGHYTAYAQNRFDSKWYNFDDSCVSSADETHVCTSAAYLLIYLRQDVYQNGLPINDKTTSTMSGAEKMDH